MSVGVTKDYKRKLNCSARREIKIVVYNGGGLLPKFFLSNVRIICGGNGFSCVALCVSCTPSALRTSSSEIGGNKRPS
jgi:hypothetical protein